jgi:hypothetical protein
LPTENENALQNHHGLMRGHFPIALTFSLDSARPHPASVSNLDVKESGALKEQIAIKYSLDEMKNILAENENALQNHRTKLSIRPRRQLVRIPLFTQYRYRAMPKTLI